MEYKTAVEPEEWYRWSRQHPEQYKIIKRYIRETTFGRPIRYNGQSFVELIIPRRWFTSATMLAFLAEYRNEIEFAHIDYQEEKDYKGEPYITIGIDYDAVPLAAECDYVWQEVRKTLSSA